MSESLSVLPNKASVCPSSCQSYLVISPKSLEHPLSSVYSHMTVFLARLIDGWTNGRARTRPIIQLLWEHSLESGKQ